MIDFSIFKHYNSDWQEGLDRANYYTPRAVYDALFVKGFDGVSSEMWPQDADLESHGKFLEELFNFYQGVKELSRHMPPEANIQMYLNETELKALYEVLPNLIEQSISVATTCKNEKDKAIARENALTFNALRIQTGRALGLNPSIL